MNIDPSILIYILGGIIVILVIWIVRMELRLGRLLIGKNARTLEDSFVTITKDLKEFHQFTKEMEHYLSHVEERLKRSIQSVETIRFNPFKGTGSGGNQSFSSSFVTENGDGVVLTSMYARDRISMFAKPLKGFKSDFELSEEEKEALDKSKSTLLEK
jgi:hypothetical protein